MLVARTLVLLALFAASDPHEGVDLEPIQLFFDSLANSSAAEMTSSVDTLRPEDTLRRLERMRTVVGDLLEAASKTAMPLVLTTIYETDISDDCLSAVLRMTSAARQQKEWPLRFLDASGRLPFSGLLDGTVADYGEYDECLAIDHVVSGGQEWRVRGKYCMAKVSLPMPSPVPLNLSFFVPALNASNTALEDTFWTFVTKNSNLFYILEGLRVGLCVPDTCSARDLQSFCTKILEPIFGFKVTFGSECETSYDVIELTSGQITAICSLATLCMAVLVSSACEWSLGATRCPEPLLCFSVFTSIRRLFQNSTHSKRLSAIHGLRVLSILWILVGHVYLLQFFQVFHVLRRTLAEMPRLSWIRYQPLKLGAFLQVDTFLMFGGITASFVTLEVMTSSHMTHKSFDFFAFLVLRWLRYTPSLLGLIFAYLLLPLFGSGPIFKDSIRTIYRPCEQFWWRNLLYINNWFDAPQNCATHTWYLAVDFQLFAFSPLFIFALKSRPKFGLLATFALIFVGSLASLLPPILDPQGLPPSMYSLNALLSDERIYYTLRALYWSTTQHVSPYYLGVLLGYVVHEYRVWRVHRVLERVLWILFFTSGLGTIFSTTLWMDSKAEKEWPPRLPRLLFTAGHKLTWTVLPAWIVVTCAFGRGGWVGRVLSHVFWVPLSRLTYGIYLCHLMPILLHSYSVRHIQAFDDFSNWGTVCLTAFMSVVMALVLWVLLESPCNGLVRWAGRDRC